MRKIAIINQKGGSCKTTTAVNLAAALAERGKKVLLIDLDPQASATSWYGIKDTGKELWEVFTENRSLRDIIQSTYTCGVDIVPSSEWLIGLEKTLAAKGGTESILKHNLQQLPNNWDFVLLDCPPNLGLISMNALVAVSCVLIPVEARIMSLSGLAQLKKTVDFVKERLNSSLRIIGILACRVDSRTRHAKEVVAEIKKGFPNLIYQTLIRENIRLSEAPSFQRNILDYAPKSSGAQDYRAFAKEIIKQAKENF